MQYTYVRVKTAATALVLVAAIVLGSGLAPRTSEALSCLAPSDLIPRQLASSSDGLVFTGTVTKVREESAYLSTNTVTVDTAHKGAVPETVIIEYGYTEDWGYGCSSGPSQVGETKTFFTGPSTDGVVTGSIAFSDDSPLHEVFVAAVDQHAPTSTRLAAATSSDAATEPVSVWGNFRAKVERLWMTIQRVFGL